MKKSLLLINLLFLSIFSIAQNGSETYDGCEGDGYSVDVNGTTYDEANPTGTETITGGAADGSDSTVVIDLTYKPNSTGSETYSGCEGDGYTVDVNGTTYDEANPTGTETLTAANGCDSIVTIDLEFLPNSTGSETYSGCEGDGYTVDVNGTTYDEANPTGTETLTAANGCDSIVTIDLEFLPNSTGSETYSGCQGDGYTVDVNGNTYDETTPTGTETLTAANGCDSIVTIDLEFTAPATGMETYSGCEGDGYTVDVNGNTYDETNPTGTETFTGGAASGCDSIVTIDLEFNTVTTTTDEVTACETYTWIDGTTYTQNNNTATHTLTSSNGCDSIINLDLTIESTLDLNVTTVVNSNDMIVLIADQDNASYQWLDCDDNYAVIPGENNQTFDPSVNGNYAVSVSTISCADTSNCVDVTTVSTEKEELVDIKVFPNPSKGKFTVSGYTDNNGSIEVIDAMGRNIKSLNITSTSTDVNLQDNQKGIYFFKVIQNNEEFIHKVIVN